MASTPTSGSQTRHSLGLLAHLARVAQREGEALPDTRGLRPRHYLVLTLLRDHGTATQRGLAEALRMDPTNIVGALNDLESRECVVRRRDPEDRRRHIVEVTDTGVEALADWERALAEVEDRVLGALSEDEREQFHALLIRAAGGQMPAGACAEADQAPPSC